MNNIKNKIKEYSKNTKIRQVVVLYLVNIIGIPLGIVTSIIITRYLGAEIYGDYSFINSIFYFGFVIFNFGFFYAGNRALILAQDKQKAQEIYGAVLVILFILFVIMSLCLCIYGLLDSNIEKKNLTNVFFVLLPFGWIFLLTNYFETLFQADNRIRELAEMRMYPKIGFFISALIIYFLCSKSGVNKLELVFGLYFLTFIIVYFYELKKIKLSFRKLKANIGEIIEFNKLYGFDVYIGSIFSVGLASLSGVIISYFGKDNSGVGFYTLALVFASPLTLIPNVIATTHYKDFAFQNKIPIKLTRITIGLTLVALIILWIVTPLFINQFYGSSFQPVIELNFIVSIGISCAGLADYFNRFLGAHGKGKILRNSSIIVGICILLSNITLVPILGEKGAAYTQVISGIIYLTNMIISYKLYCSKKQNNQILL